jgi:hypothetical protein
VKWLIQVGQGSSTYEQASFVAQLLVETETDELFGLMGPWTQQVFEAIDDLKIVTAPPVSFVISPIDCVGDNDLAALGPDWIRDGIRIWILTRR